MGESRPVGRRWGITAVLAAVAAGALGASPIGEAAIPGPDLASEVDPFIGTFAPGFTVPGAATPFGMVQVSPDTEGPFAYSGYLWTDQLITGFSHVHLSGPGVPKAGDVPFMPTVGPVVSSDMLANASPFNHATESASPGDYRVTLERGGIGVELAATTRAGVQRYTFPPGVPGNVVMDVSRSKEGRHPAAIEIVGDREVQGSIDGRYRVFFVAQFSEPFAATGTWQGAALQPGGRAAEGPETGGWVTFAGATAPQQQITVKTGISFVDIDGARANLEAEIPGWDIDEVRSEARNAWNDALGAITVDGGTPTDRIAFTTALYHSLLHPNVFSDVDGRYRGFDDQVHVTEGDAHYANFSSWDTYKAQNQLFTLIAPERYKDMARSLLADAEQGGRLPRWGEQHIDASHMSGDPAIPFIVDGLCRGALDGLDPAVIDGLYAEMRELAVVHREPALARGYLSLQDSNRAAGTTLEYGVADFALALAADRLGHTEDAARFAGDAQRWRHLFDPSTGFIRPRNADGSWLTPFSPTAEVGFQEGNSWQYTWLLPHDARGLFDAMGGDAAAVKKLDKLFSYPAASTVPVAVAEAQTRATAFGLVYRTNQYAPGNEHDLQVPWMYPFAGQPWKGQAVLRQVQGIFRPTPDGLPGNDDLGSLSAWHVLSAIGFGPATPGAPFWVVGSPLFERASIRLGEQDGAGTFTVEAPGASLASKYVRTAALDGAPLDRAWFDDGAVHPGGTLHLEMAPTPNKAWGSGTALRPPSGTGALAGFGCR